MEANDGDEEKSLTEWAWCHIQEGNPIADALDKEIKEARYLDEMSTVFKLKIICTGTLPSPRPSMKEVLQALKQCSSSKGARMQNNAKDDYIATPLLRNSKRQQELENDA